MKEREDYAMLFCGTMENRNKLHEDEFGGCYQSHGVSVSYVRFADGTDALEEQRLRHCLSRLDRSERQVMRLVKYNQSETHLGSHSKA